MIGELHQGVVAFQPLTLGREAVMLGRVQVGEIMPTERGRFQACFRLSLPDASAASWRPATDIADARRLVLVKVNDWLNAAGVVPEGTIATATDATSSSSSERLARKNGGS